MQLNKSLNLKRLAAGAGVLAAAAFCVTWIMRPNPTLQLDVETMRSITTSGTFKTVLGNGSRELHVFLSTECVYCREIEPELDKLENVTVYRHMLPGQSDAGRLAAIDVWCSSNPIETWKKVAAGIPVSRVSCDATQIEKNRAMARRLGLTSTPSIVYEDGHISAGMLLSGEIAERVAKSTLR